MRVLLDECVNPRVRAAFSDHEVSTVVDMGWRGITNGKLLALAQEAFDVFVTLDRNLEYQQNLSLLKFGIIVVRVPDNKIGSYRPLFSDLLRAAEVILPGEVIQLTRIEREND
jgi:predicted nuclease of predicted toxin-antitoxin system